MVQAVSISHFEASVMHVLCLSSPVAFARKPVSEILMYPSSQAFLVFARLGGMSCPKTPSVRRESLLAYQLSAVLDQFQ